MLLFVSLFFSVRALLRVVYVRVRAGIRLWAHSWLFSCCVLHGIPGLFAFYIHTHVMAQQVAIRLKAQRAESLDSLFSQF